MDTASLSTTNGQQVVTLPVGITLPGDRANVRTDGDSIILEPANDQGWPPGFFEAIHIEDVAFTRPDQGSVPPSPTIGNE